LLLHKNKLTGVERKSYVISSVMCDMKHTDSVMPNLITDPRYTSVTSKNFPEMSTTGAGPSDVAK